MLQLFNDPLRDALSKYFFVFGVFTILGGIIGFVKAKSRASLIAGSVSGLLLLASGWLCGPGGGLRVGVFLGLGVSAALAARFGKNYRATKKVFPALVITLLGIVGVVLCVVVLARARGAD